MIYLDASALITLVTGRPFSPELRDFLAHSPEVPMGTSTIGFVETVRTLDRVGSYPTAMQDLLASFTEILVTDEIRDAAASPARQACGRSTRYTSRAPRPSAMRSPS